MRLSLESITTRYTGLCGRMAPHVLREGETFRMGRNLTGISAFGFAIVDQEGRRRSERSFTSLREAHLFAQGLEYLLTEWDES